MPDPRQHAQRRNPIEAVLRHIPGFRGYLEKEYRRESDTLQRQWLSDRLVRAKRGLDDYTRTLADAGKIDALPECDRLRQRIDKLVSRIRGAMKGYSGVFDLVRIDESVLDRIYEHDGKLVDRVDHFGTSVEQLPKLKPEPGVAVPALIGDLEELEREWDAREDMLKGVD